MLGGKNKTVSDWGHQQVIFHLLYCPCLPFYMSHIKRCSRHEKLLREAVAGQQTCLIMEPQRSKRKKGIYLNKEPRKGGTTW